MRRSVRASVLGSLILCAGCGAESPAGPEGPGKGPTAHNSKGDAFQLVSITPTKGSRVRAGEPITVTVTLYYILASNDIGDVNLYLLNQGGLGLMPGVYAPVTKGSGTVTLTDTAIVPPRGNRWITAACAFGSPGTNLELTVRYNVE